MRYLFPGVVCHLMEGVVRRDLVLENGRLHFLENVSAKGPQVSVNGLDFHLFPGFTDVHVHLREPGFSYKETILSGTTAAARGGFTAVVTMPNLNPVPDSLETLQIQLDLIQQQAQVQALPLGAITKGQKGKELADLQAMAPLVVGFSDDGHGVMDEALMRKAMETAKELDKIIVAHCEDDSLVEGGYIHDGQWAREHGHLGISSKSEWVQVQRDLRLARETGCKYHVCHISTKESVDLIRQAKAQGVDVSCETAPHYLVLSDSQLLDEGRFKMNPPIRSARDRDALVAGLVDGTIDMLATDHAPHSLEEKAKGLRHSANGVVGLETAFAVLYTALVKPGILPLARLLDALVTRPNQRFGIVSVQDWTLFDVGASYHINPEEFLSLGRATPFEGMQVHGKCLLTMAGGKLAYTAPDISAYEVQP